MSSLDSRPLPDFILQPFFHGCAIKSGSGLGMRLGDVRRIRRKTHGTAVLLYEFTIDQPDTGMRPDGGHLQCTVCLPCS